jgi:hypothetical protein
VIRGGGNHWWPPAKQREEQRRLEAEATQLLRDDRVRRQRESAPPKPNTAAPEPASKNGWVHLEDLQRALRKKGGQICLRKT